MWVRWAGIPWFNLCPSIFHAFLGSLPLSMWEGADVRCTTVESFLFHPHSVAYVPSTHTVYVNDDFSVRRDDGVVVRSMDDAGMVAVMPPRDALDTSLPVGFSLDEIIAGWASERGCVLCSVCICLPLSVPGMHISLLFYPSFTRLPPLLRCTPSGRTSTTLATRAASRPCPSSQDRRVAEEPRCFGPRHHESVRGRLRDARLVA